MRTSYFSVAILVGIQIGLAHSDDSANGPSDFCAPNLQISAAAVSLRDKGKTKKEMEDSIEKISDSDPLKAAYMHVVVNDVYAYPNVKKYTYFAYTSASCFERSAGKRNVAWFSDIASQILACQDKNGSEPSDPAYMCIHDVVSSNSK